MKIGIITLFDCLLDCKGQKYTMMKNISRIELEMQSGEECVLLFYPTCDGRFLSYAALIKIENDKLDLYCPHVKCAEDNFGSFELEFQPFKLFNSEIKKIYKDTQAGYTIKVLSADKNFVCFDDGTQSVFDEFDGTVKHCQFMTISNFPAVLVQTNEIEKLFVFNFNKEKIDKFSGQIEIKDDDVISVICEKNDYAKHAKRTEYKYADEELTTLLSELLYTKKEPQITQNAKIVPLAFFEAVKEKNFLLAKQYLSDELVSNVTMEMLEEYFGEFDRVKPYNFQIEKGYFVNVIKGNKSKIFRIKIQNSKIDEIEFYNLK